MGGYRYSLRGEFFGGSGGGWALAAMARAMRGIGMRWFSKVSTEA